MADTVHEVKAPRQQRSRDSQERLLKAAEALIKSKGFEALTTAEVVRRSRTSIGTLYARFGDKTALLHAVQDRVQAREEAAMRAQLAKVDWDSLSLDESVRQLLEIKHSANEGDDRLFEAFVVHGATDPVLRAAGLPPQGHHRSAGSGDPAQTLRRDRPRRPRGRRAGGVPAGSGRSGGVRPARLGGRIRGGRRAAVAAQPDLLLQRLAEVIIAYLKNPQPAV